MTDRKPRIRPAALGMSLGIVFGSGAATLLFLMTGNALSFVLGGLGLVVGLLAGSWAEAAEARKKG